MFSDGAYINPLFTNLYTLLNNTTYSILHKTRLADHFNKCMTNCFRYISILCTIVDLCDKIYYEKMLECV